MKYHVIIQDKSGDLIHNNATEDDIHQCHLAAMTDTSLKLALAKMLPEVLHVSKITGDIYLRAFAPLRHVLDTELLHLVSLAEAKLTPDQFDNYLQSGWEWSLRDYVVSPWQQRVLALCKTKGIEV